jgi:cAMP-dependent protein kinase regulator
MGAAAFAGQGIVGDLVGKGEYGKAVALLKAQLSNRPHAVNLRLQLAEVLGLAGRRHEAVHILKALSSDLARHGLAAQSIAVMKRAQGLDPTATDAGLADILHGAARGARPPAPEPPPPAVPLEDAPTAERVAPVRREVLEFIGEAQEPPTGGSPAPDAVAAMPLFAGFSRDELAAVIQGLRLVACEPGDVIVAEGEPGSSLFLVTSGSAKAYVRQPDGRVRLVSRMGEGDFFGEISLLRGVPRTATVTAAARTELLELDRATVDAISASHPNVRAVLQAFCEERLSRTSS